MMVLSEQIVSGGWRIVLVKDLEGNRYIEIYSDGVVVQTYSPSHKMYGLFLSLLRGG